MAVRPGLTRALPGAAMLVLVLVAACSVTGVSGPVGPGGPPDGEFAAFPECATAELAFNGHATLNAIGLGDVVGGQEVSKPGWIQVTRDPVAMGMPPGMAPGDAPLERMVCVTWEDGSGMAGPVPAGWEPPSAFDLTTSGGSEAGPPWTLIGLVVAAAVVIGVSVVAFRREG